MTFVKKYMLFSALAITCATTFVSAAEEAKSWQAAQMRAILAQRQSREKTKRSTDFRNKPFNPENQLSSWRVPSEVGEQNLTILGMLREVVLVAALREEEEEEEAIMRARSGRKERCCFL